MELKEFYIKRWYLFGIAWFLIDYFVTQTYFRIVIGIFLHFIPILPLLYLLFFPRMLVSIIAYILKFSVGIWIYIISLFGYLSVCYFFAWVLRRYKPKEVAEKEIDSEEVSP